MKHLRDLQGSLDAPIHEEGPLGANHGIVVRATCEILDAMRKMGERAKGERAMMERPRGSKMTRGHGGGLAVSMQCVQVRVVCVYKHGYE
jgi:hypothetical protein